MSTHVHGAFGVLTVGLLLAAIPGFAQEPARRPTTPSARTDAAVDERPSAADQAFARMAAAGGHAEVEMASLALQKASSDAVKRLAQRIEADHKKANADLMSLATSKNISIDPKPTPEHEKDKARIGKLSGPQFDRAYLEVMVRDHQKTIQEFERQAKSGSDAALKTFAAQALPDLKEHLRMTIEAQKAVGSSGSGLPIVGDDE